MSDSVSLGKTCSRKPAAELDVAAESAVAGPAHAALAAPANGAEEPQRRWVADAFVRYERPLLAYACRLLHGDFGAAQDAVQETFMRLCREDPDKVAGRLAAWLFSVCRTRVIDMKRLKGVLPTSEHAAAVADDEPGPAAALEADEQSHQLAKLLDELSPRQQEVLRLRLQAELSYREIADVTGLSVSNVGFHLHAAVRSLRGMMLGA
jgi:RNA polymerase sigma-70 factor, ECF subfamily